MIDYNIIILYMNIFHQIIFVLCIYIIFSFTEYIVHRYFMHSKEKNVLSNNHWNHHKHTLDDMQLKNSDQYNSYINKYLGLYFTWPNTVIVFFVGLLEGFILYLCLSYLFDINISILSIFIWVSFFCIYQSSFWNTIHPDIHGIHKPISWWEGIPGSFIWIFVFSSIYIDNKITIYDWLKRNHTMHHLRKGDKKGNYNVTLPGADWILGTMY